MLLDKWYDFCKVNPYSEMDYEDDFSDIIKENFSCDEILEIDDLLCKDNKYIGDDQYLSEWEELSSAAYSIIHYELPKRELNSILAKVREQVVLEFETGVRVAPTEYPVKLSVSTETVYQFRSRGEDHGMWDDTTWYQYQFPNGEIKEVSYWIPETKEKFIEREIEKACRDAEIEYKESQKPKIETVKTVVPEVKKIVVETSLEDIKNSISKVAKELHFTEEFSLSEDKGFLRLQLKNWKEDLYFYKDLTFLEDRIRTCFERQIKVEKEVKALAFLQTNPKLCIEYKLTKICGDDLVGYGRFIRGKKPSLDRWENYLSPADFVDQYGSGSKPKPKIIKKK